jgi:hypothetical protein
MAHMHVCVACHGVYACTCTFACMHMCINVDVCIHSCCMYFMHMYRRIHACACVLMCMYVCCDVYVEHGEYVCMHACIAKSSNLDRNVEMKSAN